MNFQPVPVGQCWNELDGGQRLEGHFRPGHSQRQEAVLLHSAAPTPSRVSSGDGDPLLECYHQSGEREDLLQGEEYKNDDDEMELQKIQEFEKDKNINLCFFILPILQGSLFELQALTGWSGERVLYFGDHPYADLADLSLNYGWRTGAIIEEIEHELKVDEIECSMIKWLLFANHNFSSARF